jgi:hypothetical protein
VRTKVLLLVVPALACARGARAGAPGAQAEPPPSIVRIALPAEEDERRPVAVPTEPENTVEVDFPWPVEDWAGRGFTPDAEKFAGDFVIEAARGSARLFVTPIAAGAHRVLHVVVAEPGGPTRGVPIEFIPAPAGLAWSKVLFESGRAAGARPRPVSLEARPPGTRFREASAESEVGIIRTMRLILNTTEEGAGAVAAANPALSLASLDGTPRSFGDFTIANRFALRDASTGTLGLCASVANQTARRLLFEPGGWVVRVGDRVYPVPTVDFPGELEPGATGVALLVLARGPDGAPNLLLPDNTFEISAVLAGSANPRPVIRMPLKGFGPE